MSLDNSHHKKTAEFSPTYFQSHSHGGQLSRASDNYKIPLKNWIDLSTGISPFICPIPEIPNECWQRLPENNDGLEKAAENYYGSQFLLATSGSQEAIQKLPLLFSKPLTIGLISPAYHSHQQAWESAGHSIKLLNVDQIENSITELDILLLVNPTNPSGQTYSADNLLSWHKTLVRNNGFLIIDEAFMDSTPDNSLITKKPKKGLIVLRSIGKFFGLAGIRLGFVWAEVEILQELAELQDDWSVSHPARWVGKKALENKTWQKQQRAKLPFLSSRLVNLLESFIKSYNKRHDKEESTESGGVSFNNATIHSTSLFAYFEHIDSQVIHERLAKMGILTRLFHKTDYQNNAIRFGLPENEQQWDRLQLALDTILSSADNE